MRYALKSLKIFRELSQETTAYSATLLIDGKAAFACRNAGHGGCDDFHEIGDVKISDVEAELRANPPTGVKLYDFSSPLECLVARLLDLEEAARTLKRAVTTRFVFIDGNQVSTLKPAKGQKATPQWFAAIAARYPDYKRVTATNQWDEALQLLCRSDEDE